MWNNWIEIFEEIKHILSRTGYKIPNWACRRAKHGNCWIQSQAGITTNVARQKRAFFLIFKAWDTT